MSIYLSIYLHILFLFDPSKNCTCELLLNVSGPVAVKERCIKRQGTRGHRCMFGVFVRDKGVNQHDYQLTATITTQADCGTKPAPGGAV